jgi:hypothetical protein
MPAITLDHVQLILHDFLVGRKAILTLQALATTTDRRAFSGGTTIQDFIVQMAAFGTSHVVK